MYQISYREDCVEKLRVANAHSPSVSERLAELATNPRGRAVETNIPAFGRFYVNANRYDILFDIDDESMTVDIKDCLMHVKTHKILLGRIPPRDQEN